MLKGKPAIRIERISWMIVSSKMDAYLIHYNEKEYWIPKSICRREPDDSMIIQEWFYNKNMKDNG